MPLRLTDAQLDRVVYATQPLTPGARAAFLEALAARLQGIAEIGDGQLYRVVADLQKQFWDPPLGDHGPRQNLDRR
jgi:hypothetical protein